MIAPRQIIEALRDIEMVFERFRAQTAGDIKSIEQVIFGWERRLEQRRIEVEREYEEAHAQLAACRSRGYVDKDGVYHPAVCNIEEARFHDISVIRYKLLELIHAFDTVRDQHRGAASQLQNFTDNNLSEAQFWLRDRQQALEQFERSGSEIGGAAISTSFSGGSSHSATSSQFADTKGRDFSMRVYDVAGDQRLIRVYDNSKTPAVPDNPTIGNVGMANLQFERNPDGNIGRIRLQDIQTYPDYQKAGVGSKVLNQVEAIGRSVGAKEIYGEAPSVHDAVVRQWYLKRGYGFRQGTSGGTEVFKRL